MGKVLGGLEPKIVWDIFEEICYHPRPSKKEEKVAAYIENFAKELNLETIKDKLGNIIIKKPATAGLESRKGVVIQGHIDMVCEKNSDVVFDFDNDPIQTEIDGDWVRAKGTTLGADNGIGVAMGMAVLASKDIPHPAIELLCTLDEETGLTGAIQLESGLLTGKVLVNLDSEEDGAFTIGCAGGMNTAGSFEYAADTISGDSVAYQITLKGLKGGHSGIEIHDGRGNAIKLINRLLWNLTKKFDIRLASINGGNKHNAIPRESFAVITFETLKQKEVLGYITDYEKVIQSEYATKEPNLKIICEPAAIPAKVMTKPLHANLMDSLYAMPHGVLRMSPDIAGLVQTSTNLAIIETREEEVYILTSQRSSSESEKNDAGDMVGITLTLAGAEISQGDGYPGWQPNINSPILKLCKNVYHDLTGKEAHVEAIHAGLECGLIGEKYAGMDMISFGPTLKDVHSPDERVQISAVQNVWKLLKEILKNIPE